MVKEIRDKEGHLQTSPPAKVRTFQDFILTKHNTIPIDNDISGLVRDAGNRVPPEANAAIEMPIAIEELHAAVKQGKKLKAPVYDGISHDFFQLSCENIKDVLLAIANQMYMDEALLDSQKQGIIVCVPKTQ